jgi:large subunit ribosomal protein L15
MKLNDLRPNEGAKKERKRVGRGHSAGQGKTAGRGTKGQGSRAGSGGNLYRQGGNLPFYRRLPFMRGEGFTPPNRVEYNEVNITQLARFEADTEVTPEVLAAANVISKPSNPVALLGNGDVTVPLKIRLHRVTKVPGRRLKLPVAVLKLLRD